MITLFGKTDNLQENDKFIKRQNLRPWKTNIVKYHHGSPWSKSVSYSELNISKLWHKWLS